MKRRTGLIVFLVILAILLLISVSAFCYLKFCGFSFENTLSLDNSDAPYAGTLSFSDDGRARVTLTKADLYWLADEYGYLDRLHDLPEHVSVKALDFTLRDGGLEAVADVSYGLLPVPLKLTADAAYTRGAIDVTLTSAMLGRWLTLPLDKLEARGLPLTFSFDLGELDLKSDITDVAFTADGVQVEKRFLPGFVRSLGGLLNGDAPTADALYAYEGEAAREDSAVSLLSQIGYGPSVMRLDALSRELLTGGDVPEAILRMPALCPTDTVERLYAEKLDEFDAHFIVPRERAEAYRAGYDSRVAAGQRPYETLLLTLRKLYQAGKLTIGKGGAFTYTETGEPLLLSALSPDAHVDDETSRVVLMRSLEAVYPVNMADMPRLGDVPSKAPIPKKLELLSHDLGVYLTMPCGKRALLYQLASGRFAVHLLDEGAYEAAVGDSVPSILFSDALPQPASGRTEMPAPADGLLPYEIVNGLGLALPQ